jgi:hypothetical protein
VGVQRAVAGMSEKIFKWLAIIFGLLLILWFALTAFFNYIQ